MNFIEQRKKLRRSGTHDEINKAIVEIARKQHKSNLKLKELEEEVKQEQLIKLELDEHQGWLLNELERHMSEAQQSDGLDLMIDISPVKSICSNIKQESVSVRNQNKLAVPSPMKVPWQTITPQSSFEYGRRASEVETLPPSGFMSPINLFPNMPVLEGETPASGNDSKKKVKKRKHFDN